MPLLLTICNTRSRQLSEILSNGSAAIAALRAALRRGRSLDDLDPFFHHARARAMTAVRSPCCFELWLGVNFRVLRIVENPRNAEHIAEAASAAPLIVGPCLSPKRDRETGAETTGPRSIVRLVGRSTLAYHPFRSLGNQSRIDGNVNRLRSLSGRPPQRCRCLDRPRQAKDVTLQCRSSVETSGNCHSWRFKVRPVAVT